MGRTTVVISDELRDEAKEYDINISDVLRYALAAAVESKRRLAAAPPEFEIVGCVWDRHGDEQLESIQFIGRQVWQSQEEALDVYVTQQGRIVEVEDGGHAAFVIYESLDDYRTTFGGDRSNLPLNAVEEALGQVETPRMLDI